MIPFELSGWIKARNILRLLGHNVLARVQKRRVAGLQRQRDLHFGAEKDVNQLVEGIEWASLERHKAGEGYIGARARVSLDWHALLFQIVDADEPSVGEDDAVAREQLH